jgi:hypothetical protein
MDKSTAIFIEPLFFPPVHVWVKLLQYDKIIINHQNSYRKQTLRNRCCILGPNNKQDLIIPITRATKHNAMHEVIPESTTPWINQHLKSIQTAYGKSPFYEYYKDELLELYQHFKGKTLAQINVESMSFCLKKMRITIDITTMSRNAANDAHNLIDLSNCLSDTFIPRAFHQLPYTQVFGSIFAQGLSVLDTLFCIGPQTAQYILQHKDYPLEL